MFGFNKNTLSKGEIQAVFNCYGKIRTMVSVGMLKNLDKEIGVLDELIPQFVANDLTTISEYKWVDSIKAFIKFETLIEIYARNQDDYKERTAAEDLARECCYAYTMLTDKLNKISNIKKYSLSELKQDAKAELDAHVRKINTTGGEVKIDVMARLTEEDKSKYLVHGDMFGKKLKRTQIRIEVDLLQKMAVKIDEILRNQGMYYKIMNTSKPLNDLLFTDIAHFAIWAASLDGVIEPGEVDAIFEYAGLMNLTLRDVEMEYSLNKCAYDNYENSVPDSLIGFMAGDLLMKEAGLINPGEEMASCKAFYMLLSDITSAIIAGDREVSAIEVERQKRMLNHIAAIVMDRSGVDVSKK